MLDDLISNQGNPVGHEVVALGMADMGAILLSKADGHHLHQAAFIGALEAGVGLHPIQNNDAIRLIRVLVNADLEVLRMADLNRLHRGQDRAAHAFLRDAQGGQDHLLPLRSGAAVAAMAGIRKGSAPISFSRSARYRIINVEFETPRLPQVMQIRIPGRIFSRISLI